MFVNRVKITVLKTTFDRELAAEYGVDGLGPCPMMKAGQVFYADYAKPDGLCDEAWKAIYQYVFALAHGAGSGLFYFGNWIKKPGKICLAGLMEASTRLRQSMMRPSESTRIILE